MKIDKLIFIYLDVDVAFIIIILVVMTVSTVHTICHIDNFVNELMVETKLIAY